jgi:hypothetical protein
MRLAYPLADRDPLPAVPRCLPACATSSAHNGQPLAAAPALALSHLDPLQSRYAGLPFSPQGLQPPYRPDGTPDRRTVNQALPAGRVIDAGYLPLGVQVQARRPDPPSIFGSRGRGPMTASPLQHR